MNSFSSKVFSEEFSVFQILLIVYFAALASADDIDTDLASGLAQMPLDKLLHVKQLLFTKNDDQYPAKDETQPETDSGFSPKSPGALKLKGDWLRGPLRKKQDQLKRGDWIEDWNGKGGKLQHVFASTVTILAFLAFGGYLITMVVLALRNNQGLLAPLAPTTASPITTSILGRKRRAIDESPFVDDAVDSLHRLARGYSCFRALNSSKRIFSDDKEFCF